MDVNKALSELYEEKKRLDATIAALETHLRGGLIPTSSSRRGRKSMSPEERLAVSRRMSKYWEARKAASNALESAAAAPSQG